MITRPQDALKPQYIAVVEHTEYEQSIATFISEDNARKWAEKWPNCDVIIARIIDSVA